MREGWVSTVRFEKRHVVENVWDFLKNAFHLKAKEVNRGVGEIIKERKRGLLLSPRGQTKHTGCATNVALL